jgi:hypothetical protein
MPSVMISAKSEIMLKLMPAAYMTAMAASMATGMPAATQKAVRALRKRKRSSTTSPSPISPLRTRSCNRPSITSARACASSIRTPSGRVGVISAARRATSAWMPMASPDCDRSTRSTIAGASPTQ